MTGAACAPRLDNNAGINREFHIYCCDAAIREVVWELISNR